MGVAATKVGTVSVSSVTVDTTQLREFVFGPRPHRTLFRVVLWSVLTLAFFHHLLVPIQIIGSSMSPTYLNGSLNLVNRVAYTRRHQPSRGDVVALNVEGELLLKRIVALPGEKVSIVGGILLVNGRPLADAFSKFAIPCEMDPIFLRAEEYFVIGDNRASSVFCKVPRRDILGKTVF
jgi:signal peptidase I